MTEERQLRGDEFVFLYIFRLTGCALSLERKRQIIVLQFEHPFTFNFSLLRGHVINLCYIIKIVKIILDTCAEIGEYQTDV